MKIPRRLAATAAPLALALITAGPALAAAAPQVSFRVEGAQRTLLAPRTVTVPQTGSITTGGTPAGSCPADSAAGALNAATGGRWNGTYSSGLGVEVTNILGVNALYSRGSYWEFFVNDRVASTGICDTKVHSAEQLLFAQVPAKGTELPIVVSAPRRVTDGRNFTVKTFVYTGSGDATRPVDGVRLSVVRGGDETAKVIDRHDGRGTTTYQSMGTGRITLVATAKGAIRSAPFSLTLAR